MNFIDLTHSHSNAMIFLKKNRFQVHKMLFQNGSTRRFTAWPN